jgi:Rrf2 family transcriptional regulator, iron-sulfur cluster assembly transcription factor
MVFLAGQSGQAVETAKVAQATDVPPVYLRKIFQSLARSGLVRTTAGSGGGVALASKPGAVTLKDIIEAVEGPIVLSDCIEHSSVCPRSAKCKTNNCLAGIQARIQREFSSHTLADLM